MRTEAYKKGQVSEILRTVNMIGVQTMRNSNVPDMGPGRDDPERKEAVAKRMHLIVGALKALGQVKDARDLCDQADIAEGSWNNAASGQNRLTMDAAAQLYRTFGISLQYTILGIKAELSPEMRREISKLEDKL